MNKNLGLNFRQRPGAFVLLTGATGLLGRYLMRDLLLQGVQVAVIVRPNKKMNAQQRIESIMQQWEMESGTKLPRPTVFEGDICEPSLGLNSDSVDWIGQHCGKIIHSAAVLQFQGATESEEPWRTNLGGTRNVLEFVQRVNIEKFHYVSTAYVCGIRSDQVLESELDCEQEFRNDYERSKFAAEKLVRSASHLKEVTVYRPTVIVGDSKTGYTSTYHGLYLYLRLVATLVPLQPRNADGLIETPICLPMEGDEPRNLVPVDWVSEVITHLFCDSDAPGRTYHLSPDHFVTARDLIEDCYEYFDSCGVEFGGSETPRHDSSDFAARFFENTSIYESYETSDPEFDKSNLVEFAGHLPCPEIDKAMIFRFLEFGIADRWGKQRRPIPVMPQAVVPEVSRVLEC